MRTLFVALAILIVPLFANQTFAEDNNFEGTFTMNGPDDVITLTLAKDSEGNYKGTLSSTTGLSFDVEGMLEEGFLLGACYNNEFGVFFEAGFEGDVLYFVLIEPDENNMPNYDKTTELSFTRSNAAPAQNDSVPPSLKDKITGGAGKAETKKSDDASKNIKMVDSDEIKEGEIGKKSWGYKFKAPAGWVHQIDGDAVLLGHNSIAGMLVVVKHDQVPFETMKGEMGNGLNEEGVSLLPEGELKKIDESSLSGTFKGTLDSTTVRAYSIGTVSPFGKSGVYIVAITTPEQFKSELTNCVDEIFKSLKFFKVEMSELHEALAGQWSTIDETNRFWLYKDGTFSYKYEYAAWSDPSVSPDLTWGVSNQSSSRGTWEAEGTKESGVLTFKYEDGSVKEMNYNVFVEKGQTYWNEYKFNGTMYVRKPID